MTKKANQVTAPNCRPAYVMVTYDLHPPTGIGPVRVGMSRDQVRGLMPDAPEVIRKKGYRGPSGEAYHGGAFQVYYAEQTGEVTYIQVPTCAGLRLVYKQLDIFDASLDTVLEALNKKGAQTVKPWFEFPDLGLLLLFGEALGQTFVTCLGIGNHPVYEPEP